jgi:hypothetical protein
MGLVKFDYILGKFRLNDNPNPNAAARSFVKSFNATTDWGTAITGFYTITIPAVEHGMGTAPNSIQLFDTTTGSSVVVTVDELGVTASGDINITVTDVPDRRFVGKIAIIQ